MLLIFDLDGTLCKTDEVSIAAVSRAMADVNLPAPAPREIVSLIGEPMDAFCRALAPDATPNARQALWKRIRYHEDRLIPQYATLYDGMEKTLRRLKAAGHTLAICSNGGQPYIDNVLDACRLRGLFVCVKGKVPAKTKADRIKEIREETNASDAVVIGDRIHDIEAARANGLPCVAVTYGFARDDLADADALAHTPADILTIVASGRLGRLPRDGRPAGRQPRRNRNDSEEGGAAR